VEFQTILGREIDDGKLSSGFFAGAFKSFSEFGHLRAETHAE